MASEKSPIGRRSSAPKGVTVPSALSRLTGDSVETVCGVIESLDDTCRKWPHRTAVSDSSRSLTYRSLHSEILHLANHLAEAGVKRGEIVAVHLNRSVDVVVCVFAIWKLRAVFLPVDPKYPEDRTALMIADSKAQHLIVATKLEAAGSDADGVQVLALETVADSFVAGATDLSPLTSTGETHPTDTAYVIYTSGSTGRPKGVVVSHLNLATYLAGLDAVISPGGDEDDVQQRWICATSISFDLSVPELWWAASRGHRLFVQEGVGDGTDGHASTLSLLRDHAITHGQFTPSFIGMLRQSPHGTEAVANFRGLLLGGEPIPSALARDVLKMFAKSGGRLLNMYGPTETTGASAYAELSLDNCAGTACPIGRPLVNEEVFVVDENMNVVPIGETGEILVAGDKVTKGYLGRADLTAQKFIPHPLRPEAVAYRTGDLGRVSDDGVLFCKGRIDRQVKVRGFRVELGEVEALLELHPRVKSAAATTFPTDNTTLLAGFVIVDGNAPIERELRLHMKAVAPAAFVPSAIVVLETFPLAPTGKIDFSALPDPRSIRSKEQEGDNRHTPTEASVLNAWRRALSLDDIRLDDNFFDLGGQSLIAIEMLTDLNREFGVELTVDTLFSAPTVRTLAKKLDALQAPATDDEEPGPKFSPLVDITPASALLPTLFCVHGAGGNVLNFYDLAKALQGAASFVGIQAFGIDGLTPPLTTIEAMAERYVDHLQERQPTGPYHLGGYSGGGLVAYEMAQRLVGRGEEVSTLLLLDSYPPGVEFKLDPTAVRLARIVRGGLPAVRDRVSNRVSDRLERTKSRLNLAVSKFRGVVPDFETRDHILMNAFAVAEAAYDIRPYPGKVVLLSTKTTRSDELPDHQWTPLVRHLRVIRSPGTHDDFLLEHHLGEWLPEIREVLTRATV